MPRRPGEPSIYFVLCRDLESALDPMSEKCLLACLLCDQAGSVYARTMRRILNLALLFRTDLETSPEQVEEADERWDHELLLNKIMHDVTLEKEELERQASGVAAAAT